jgi:sugar lactone lactonase YvrE
MPVLRPSGSDFTSFVKAAAQYVPAGRAGKPSKSGGVPVALPGLGAIVRASQVGALASPTTSAVVINGITPPGGGGAPAGPRVISYTSANAVSTILAGNGALGYNDATGVLAAFRYPIGVLELPDGNILVCDSSNNRIRIVTPAGVVTTLAGSTEGLADGTGAAAQFNLPWNAVRFSDGKIIVSDRFNNCLRLVTYPGGVVTTFAAGGGFSQPMGISVLPNGNFVVTDTNNNIIKYVTYPGGVVTTLATGFTYPHGIAALPDGNMVVTEYLSNQIKLITTSTYAANSGVVTVLAGSTSSGLLDGTGTAARFTEPEGLAVLPNGNIIVVDVGNGRIRLVTYPGGVVTTLATTNGRSAGILSNGNIVTGETYGGVIRILSFT